MKKHRSRSIYRILRYMSRKGNYPDGIPRLKLTSRFDENTVSELLYYDYLDETTAGGVYITVKGREALQIHVLTVVNIHLAVVAAAAAVIALFL